MHAEDLFIGWLGKKKWSWRVVAGQNVAYDQFPCQYQLYYRGKAKNSLWYDPVFQVKLATQSLHVTSSNAVVLSACVEVAAMESLSYVMFQSDIPARQIGCCAAEYANVNT